MSGIDHPDIAPQVTGPPEVTGPTPSQTVGPYFSIGLAWMDATDLAPPGTPGAVPLSGRVLDGAGAGVPDALVEIWLGGDGAGGFGRALTDADGTYRFTIVPPAAAAGGSAPRIDVSVFARGLMQRLVTRIYLPGEPTNATDPVLGLVGEDRRSTLVAAAAGGGLVHDIRLQGEEETVFFAW